MIDAQTTPPTIQISAERCTRCGRCVATCPRQLLVHENKRVYAIDNLTRCIVCGHCVAVCPENAVAHSQVPADAAPPLPEIALTDQQLEYFLRRRRSIRKFKPDPVEPAKLDRLLDIARYAPTGKNFQAVHYTVLTGQSILRLEKAAAEFYRKLVQRLQSPVGRQLVGLVAGRKMVETLIWGLPDLKRDVAAVDRGQPTYCHAAPLVIAVHGEPSTTMHEDCSYAAYHILLTAETLGLGTCLVGYITGAAERLKSVGKAIDLPAGHRIYSTVAVGYSAERFVRLVPRNAPIVRRLS